MIVGFVAMWMLRNRRAARLLLVGSAVSFFVCLVQALSLFLRWK